MKFGKFFIRMVLLMLMYQYFAYRHFFQYLPIKYGADYLNNKFYLLEFYGTAIWFIYGMILYLLAVGKQPGWSRPVQIDIKSLNPYQQKDLKLETGREVETWKDKYGFHNFCHTCKMQRFPRTHHCNQCGRCSDGHDHHCVWLN